MKKFEKRCVLLNVAVDENSEGGEYSTQKVEYEASI